MAAPIPRRAFLLAGAWSARLRAEAVAAALANGLRAGGAPAPDVALLEDAGGKELARMGFDERMRAARAVIIAPAALDPHTISRGPAFEAATRARQSGVPAYAVARESSLSSFDARVLDLQLVLVARTQRALADAGARLAEVL